MKIAIHHRKEGFSSSWIKYCKKQGIDYKIVNCYDTDIVEQLSDCNALMWHFHQANCRDILFAKQLLYSLQTTGKVVFPDFHTAWHFDDKVGQMYLLESVGAPVVPSYIFYDKAKAYQWVDETTFPKVFKLRTGSGSSQVRLVHDRKSAKKIIKQAFGRGFKQYEPRSNLKERWRKFQTGKANLWGVMKGMLRFGYTTDFDRVAGNEKGYVYFQDFIPDNEFDIRVIVVDGKACAIKRINREGDFRASGSGNLQYEKHHFSDDLIDLAFEYAEKINSKSLAIDFVFDGDNPLFVELSYGFPAGPFTSNCPGYWDRELKWHPEAFSAPGWMVESVIRQIQKQPKMSKSV
jgi:glutathione synthase/RimK-type ligase-like ATP-grasp enzyme